jgi:hypothetical protein
MWAMKGVGVLDGMVIPPETSVPRETRQWPEIGAESPARAVVAPRDGLSEPVAGLAAGVRIATARGWRRVEALEPGDRLMTRDNGLATLVALQRRRVAAQAVLTLRPGDVRGLDADVLLGAGTEVLWTGRRVDEILGTREGLLAVRDLGAAPTGEPGFITLFLPVLARQEMFFAEGMAVASALPEDGRPARHSLSRSEALRVLRH